MPIKKAAVAAAMIASTQAVITGEGSFAGPGYANYATKYSYWAGIHSGVFNMEWGVKEVTFADNTDFEAESVWCLPNGTPDMFYCMMATIVDPLGAKLLTFKAWKSTAKVTFTNS